MKRIFSSKYLRSAPVYVAAIAVLGLVVIYSTRKQPTVSPAAAAVRPSPQFRVTPETLQLPTTDKATVFGSINSQDSYLVVATSAKQKPVVIAIPTMAECQVASAQLNANAVTAAEGVTSTATCIDSSEMRRRFAVGMSAK